MSVTSIIKASDAKETISAALEVAEEIVNTLRAAHDKIHWRGDSDLLPLGDPNPLIEKVDTLVESIWDLDYKSFSTDDSEELLRYGK